MIFDHEIASASTHWRCILHFSLLFSSVSVVDAFGANSGYRQLGKYHSSKVRFRRREFIAVKLSQSSAGQDCSGEDKEKEEHVVEEPAPPAVNVDLTDGFKHKLHALMGDYDPEGVDDENQDGNIMNVMLNFPLRYSFHVVGRTSGNEEIRDSFVEQVKNLVSSAASDDEDEMECRVTPRGKNFTRVSVQVMVESATQVSGINTELKDLELTVMSY